MRPKRFYVNRSPNFGFFIVFINIYRKQIHERNIPFDSCSNNKEWWSYERSADRYVSLYLHSHA